ncbi:fimbria adhesin protein [Escherichia coli TA206]|uniref:fimbrial protein n=1 Tax=Escherichia coli TaxID=562 RepID=UPI0001E8AA6B|nr:fimbrial protein [Escherichia coli]EGI25823.1 fimbria adhesin protein [Escherichia coli TA206]
MSLICRKLMLLVVVLIAGVTRARADCWRGPAATYRLDMVMGRVVVSPDLPVGAVIAQHSWTMPAGMGINYSCFGKNTFRASIVATGVTSIGNGIYSTAVPGIGIRFSRGGNKVNIMYPGQYTVNADKKSDYRLEGSRFTVELIKTAAVTGSGPLAAGEYTSYDWEHGYNPILKTFLSANAVTVVSPSCTILSGRNMNVDVGSIRRSDLKGTGKTAGGKDFSIRLQCSGGLSESGYASIHISFSGNPATGTETGQGVLLNEKTGSGMAQGVGIQVLKEGTPLKFNSRYETGRLTSQGMRYISVPLRARFYQYAPDITTGEVESHMVFNLTYD